MSEAPKKAKHGGNKRGHRLPVLRELDQYRYIKVKTLGYTEEQVAEQEGVTAMTVRNSVENYTFYKEKHTLDAVAQEQAATILAIADLERQAIRNALTAQKPLQNDRGEVVRDEENKPILIPDSDMQLRAVEMVTDKVAAIQPKGKGLSVNVGVQNQTVLPGSGGMRFEDKLRLIQQRRNELPGTTESTVIVEAEPTE